MKKLIIASGTGFLGNVITTYFKNQFEEIVILTRGKTEIKNGIKYIHWDAKTATGWEAELEDSDVLINLAGKSVDCRYTEKNKSEILTSRIDSTKILNDVVKKCQNPPKHWLNSSTATIYRHSTDKQMDEADGEIGDNFSMNVAKAWEKTFFETETPRTLKTGLRTSIVLGKKGGAFIPLRNLAKIGFGGKQGKGTQFISWIHERDFARAIDFIIKEELQGVINVVSPQPIKNEAFMKSLRKELNMPIGIPINKTLLEIGAKIIKTETELVLKSRNVIPKRLEENGFQFEFQSIGKTFKDLLQN